MKAPVIVLERTGHIFTLYQHDRWLTQLRAEGIEVLGNILHQGALTHLPTDNRRDVEIRLYGYIGTKRAIDVMVAVVQRSGKTTFMPDYLYVVYVLQGTQLVFNGVFASNTSPDTPFVHTLPHFMAAGALAPRAA